MVIYDLPDEATVGYGWSGESLLEPLSFRRLGPTCLNGLLIGSILRPCADISISAASRLARVSSRFALMTHHVCSR